MAIAVSQVNHGAESRLRVLDGWRGISILLVLAAHLLPLGPSSWQLNAVAGAMGMALFFTLSGFLITRLLLSDHHIPSFLIKRFMRIVPLAWLVMLFALYAIGAAPDTWVAHVLFYANLPPIKLTSVTSHFWSLCVEVQFYVGIALAVRLFGRRALFALPVVCVAVTMYRMWAGAHIDIVTIRRVDEILAGCVLALLYSRQAGRRFFIANAKWSPYVLLLCLAVSSHPSGTWMNYARPYFAALLVGGSILGAGYAPWLDSMLKSRVLRYCALVSYALYVFHGALRETWLGTGEGFVKYAKRPLLFVVTFGLAHISSFYYEVYFINLGKRLSGLLSRKVVQSV